MKRVSSVLIVTIVLVLTLLSTLTLGAQNSLQAAAATTPTKTKAPATATTAPPPNIPLYIGVNNGKSLVEGDVWAWSAAGLSKRTNNGHNQLPTVSPTADRLVYLQVPHPYLKIRTQYDDFDGPTDVILFDLKTNQATAIATQPKDIMADAQNNSYRLAIRSQPSWSPDGKALAWTEIVTDGPNNLNVGMDDEQLVVYDLVTKQRRTVVNKLPEHRSVGPSPRLSYVSWGPTGLLAVFTSTSLYVDPNSTDELTVYDLQGHQLSNSPKINSTDPAYDYTAIIWLTDTAYPTLSCIGCFTQIDPFTGELLPLPGTPEVYSALAPHKISLYFGTDSGTEGNVTWLVLLNGVQVSKFDSVRLATLSDFGISPDGMQVAVANFAGQGSTAGVFVYRAKVPDRPPVSVILNVIGMGWGPLAWRVFPDLSQYF